ncbi:MAG: zinc ribbon domain-containing protein [Anaerolineae bacterium]|nr:zinc ribbon domain-containing protein [Anaerolineae bacterium]
MPLYEYFCRSCNTKHDKIRAIADADAPIECPECHEVNSVRALSMVVMHVGGRTSAASGSDSAPAASSGGCCGGACGCGHSHAHSLN